MSTIRRRIQTYVATDLARRLRDHCASVRASESAVLREALDVHLDGRTDMALVLRRLDRIARAQERTLRDLELLSQALAMFVRLWLAHTPRLPRDARPAAQASAESRFKQFLDHVAARFASGKRFVDDLPQERIADDDELASIAQAAEADLASQNGAGPSGSPLPGAP